MLEPLRTTIGTSKRPPAVLEVQALESRTMPAIDVLGLAGDFVGTVRDAVGGAVERAGERLNNLSTTVGNAIQSAQETLAQPKVQYAIGIVEAAAGVVALAGAYFGALESGGASLGLAGVGAALIADGISRINANAPSLLNIPTSVPVGSILLEQGFREGVQQLQDQSAPPQVAATTPPVAPPSDGPSDTGPPSVAPGTLGTFSGQFSVVGVGEFINGAQGTLTLSLSDNPGSTTNLTGSYQFDNFFGSSASGSIVGVRPDDAPNEVSGDFLDLGVFLSFTGTLSGGTLEGRLVGAAGLNGEFSLSQSSTPSQVSIV